MTALALNIKSRATCFIYAGDVIGRLIKLHCLGRVHAFLSLPSPTSMILGVINATNAAVQSVSVNRGTVIATVDKSLYIVDSNNFQLSPMNCQLPAPILQVFLYLNHA